MRAELMLQPKSNLRPPFPLPIRLAGNRRDSARTAPVPRGSRTAVPFTDAEKSDDIEPYASWHDNGRTAPANLSSEIEIKGLVGFVS
jgi:hypothetical protein